MQKNAYFAVLLGTMPSLLMAQDPGDNFFPQWTVHEIRFQFAQTGFWDSLTANYTLDRYMSADVEIDGQPYPNSGVKYKGNSSYNNPGSKKPFRIDLAEYVDGQAHDGLKKLVLNNGFKDPTLMREKIMLDFLNENGIAAPRCAYARLYVNGTYRGLYTVVEDVNKTFLEDRFGNKDGNLFKGDPKGTLVWKGTQQGMYQPDYELKTNEVANDWSDLIQLTNALNNTPADQLADTLPQYLNTDSWFKYWAAHALFVNLDSYIGSGHNYFLYHNTDTDQFEWITWDVNEAFGNFQMNQSLNTLKNMPYGQILSNPSTRPMMAKTWAVAEYQQQLADAVCTLLPYFSNTALDSKIDSLANLIRADVYADNFKFFSNTQFDTNIEQDLTSVPGAPGTNGIAGLKPFILARHLAVAQQLNAQNCDASIVVEDTGYVLVQLWPNPSNGTLHLAGVYGGQLQVFNVWGYLVHEQAMPPGAGLVTFQLAHLPAGTYFCVVGEGEKRKVHRFVLY